MITFFIAVQLIYYYNVLVYHKIIIELYLKSLNWMEWFNQCFQTLKMIQYCPIHPSDSLPYPNDLCFFNFTNNLYSNFCNTCGALLRAKHFIILLVFCIIFCYFMYIHIYHTYIHLFLLNSYTVFFVLIVLCICIYLITFFDIYIYIL